MKKIIRLIFAFCLLWCNSITAQDTIVFKNQTIKVVQILSVQKNLSLLAYVEGPDTVFVNLSTIQSYVAHSEIENKQADLIISNTPDVTGNAQVHPKRFGSGGVVRKESKFEHDPFNIGFNLLSPLSALGGGSSISTNPSLEFYGEYLIKSWLGLAFDFRIGLGTKNIPQTSSQYFSIRRYDRETLFEIGFTPILYMNQQKFASMYFNPGIHVGLNQGVNTFYYNDYYSQIYQATYESFQRTYYRVSLSLGLQLNPWRTISLSFECGPFLGNHRQYEYNSYQNSYMDPVFQEQVYTYNKLRFGFQGAINLIYRFGGEPKAKEN